jgi:3-hydroxyisobutyrate dehydrogenase-like beta-hydroxyacid dehydrogenase
MTTQRINNPRLSKSRNGIKGKYLAINLVEASHDLMVLVLAAATPDTVVVIHSTVEPSSIAKIARAAAPLKVEVVDAPVSGGELGAKGKTMSYMVGGSDRAVERCLPLFRTSGPSITRTGPSGTGIQAKLAHQLIICLNMLAASEGMRLGRAAGLSSTILEQVVDEGGCSAVSPIKGRACHFAPQRPYSLKISRYV